MDFLKSLYQTERLAPYLHVLFEFGTYKAVSRTTGCVEITWKMNIRYHLLSSTSSGSCMNKILCVALHLWGLWYFSTSFPSASLLWNTYNKAETITTASMQTGTRVS